MTYSFHFASRFQKICKEKSENNFLLFSLFPYKLLKTRNKIEKSGIFIIIREKEKEKENRKYFLQPSIPDSLLLLGLIRRISYEYYVCNDGYYINCHHLAFIATSITLKESACDVVEYSIKNYTVGNQIKIQIHQNIFN